MPRVTVHVVIDAPASAVWNELADIGSHPEWMADAIAIEFVGDQRIGVGTRFNCLTGVGPFRTHDHMVITEWDEERVIGVCHTGLVTGDGRFTIEQEPERDDRTVVSWSERLRFPWYLGGPLTAFAAKPVLRRIWRKNLHRFASRFHIEG